ncbi:MAG: hypothetical protein GC164_03405 [Phycisphaera sp.]|nr:hypothetical protein [Phycisphaera sp.]
MDTAPVTHLTAADMESGLLAWIDRYRYWLLGGAIALLLAGFNGQWQVSSDICSYYAWAREMALGETFPRDTIARHQAPGMAYLLALALWAAGEGRAMGWAHAGLMGFALVGLGVSYLLIRRVAGRPMAVMATFAVAISYTYVKHVYCMMVDVPFAVCVWLALYGWELRRSDRAVRVKISGWLLVAVSLVAGLILRRAVVLVVAALAVEGVHHLYVTGKRRAALGAVMVGCALLVLTLWLTGAVSAGAWLSPKNVMGQFEDAGLIGANGWQRLVLPGWKMVSEDLPEVGTGIEWGPVIDEVISLLIILACVRLWRLRASWSAMLVVLLLVCLVKMPTPRYWVMAIPMLAVAWWRTVWWLAAMCPVRARHWVVIALLAGCVVPNLVKDIEAVVHQRQTPFIEKHKDGRYASLTHVCDFLRTLDPDVVVVGPYSAELRFFSRRTSYGPWFLLNHPRWDDAQVRQWLDRHKGVYLVEPAPEQSAAFLNRMGLVKSNKVYESPVFGRQPPWTVWRLQPVRDNTPSTPGGTAGSVTQGQQQAHGDKDKEP